jgi:pimeloyl-ACP methyl ester carboxylesterase
MMVNTAQEISTRTLPRVMQLVWRDGWVSVALTVGVAVIAGVLAARIMPRGPTTANQALLVMGSGLVIGFAAGLLMRSRWAMLLAPVAYGIAFELGRLGTMGPTAGAIRLDEPFGILALMLGRGVHGLLVFLPMVFATSLGIAFARVWSANAARVNESAGLISWIPTGIAATGLMALAVLIALPARTPPILGPDGKPLPGSIASLEQVRLGGRDQWIMIRAYHPDKPVMLYLSGGPGQSDLPFSRVMFDDLSREFVVVSWDQRGTGKSYETLDPTSDLTLERAISDTLELTKYLSQRFGKQKIYLLGESWGSTLGVLAVQRQPELYAAWIGSGQMVSQRETDRRLYRDVIALATRTGDTAKANKMRGYGEPPYADIPYANAFVMGNYEALEKPYTPPQAYLERGDGAKLGPFGVFGSEYNLIEKFNVLRGLIDMFSVMYPQLQRIDFRKDVTRLEVPVYILDGAAELTARRDLALEWFNALKAPKKQLFTLEHAGHSVVFEEFEAFKRIMLETVLPETYRAQSP